jgi:hypothetical protein
MSAAFWNGFPFIYPDIGTYLGSGFIPEMPIDRPIAYGLFIFATSLGGLSLWLTIFIIIGCFNDVASFIKIEPCFQNG